MAGFEGIGRVLIIVGISIVVVGLVLSFVWRLPFLGKLPDDILIREDGVSFYFLNRYLPLIKYAVNLS